MTRDELAARAMQGFISRSTIAELQTITPKDASVAAWVATNAYQMADAMLKARRQKPAK